MNSILARFFSDIRSICGHEATFQASLAHHLALAGVPVSSIHRELSLGDGPIDVVVKPVDKSMYWDGGTRSAVAIEIKGGAYGSRNALSDVIDADGYCADIGKLEKLAKTGVECWFICIDVEELGISLSVPARRRVAAQCGQRNLRFAYYAQGESNFYVLRQGRLEENPIPDLPTLAVPSPARWSDCLREFSQLARQASGSESTYVGLLYHALAKAGFESRRLSLETYFSCAAGGSKMQNRPDLCVFRPEVAGRFNLYKKGIRSQSNDGIKIGSLEALVEVKGSTATQRGSQANFYKDIEADIHKLAGWRDRFQASGYLSSGPGRVAPEYVMIGMDNRRTPVDPDLIAQLTQLAAANGVSYHHVRVA